MADFQFRDHGSITVLKPLSEAAREWVNANIPEDAQWWCGGVVIEPRYVDPILNGIENEGMEISG